MKRSHARPVKFPVFRPVKSPVFIPVKSPVFPGDSYALNAKTQGQNCYYWFSNVSVALQLELAELSKDMTES